MKTMKAMKAVKPTTASARSMKAVKAMNAMKAKKAKKAPKTCGQLSWHSRHPTFNEAKASEVYDDAQCAKRASPPALATEAHSGAARRAQTRLALAIRLIVSHKHE